MDFKNKKIAVVSSTMSMPVCFLVPHIKFMIDHGAAVDVFANQAGYDCSPLERLENCKLYNVQFSRSPLSIKNISGYKLLKKYFKHTNYDLVYCQQPVGGVMGRMIAKKFKIPCIYTAHGFHFFQGNSKIKNLIFRTIEKHYSKYTDALVTINQEDYNAAQKFKAKKVYKINGIGVDLSKYKVNMALNKSEFKKSLGLNEDDFVITSIGELNENKNTLRLIEVMAQISEPKIKYLICGQGPLKDKYEESIKKHGLENRVKLLGFRTDIPDILTITDLYIMPSYREGLSKSMMEAMCYGLPIVASKIRGNVDLVGENEGGILCTTIDNQAYADAITQMYSDKTLAKSMGKRNKEFIKNFDINVVLQQMEEIYKEM
ncbi:MAG: glycosyltransferase family 4 protein [Firmicutes bacterium]|nr:glycosyltransferase family 4 protein [Bacillota bacterium]